MKKIVLLLSVFILASCASTKQFQQFTHSTELETAKARIYVIRPGFVGGAVSTSIFCNDILIGKTGGNGYLCWDVLEGKYTVGNTQLINAGVTLGTAANEELFVINAKPGKTYFIRQYARVGGFSFELLDKHKGESYLKGKSSPKINYAE